MHDITYANEIVRALQKKINSLNKGDEITLVKAALSPLSHVTPESLEAAFRTVVKGTPMENVPLSIKTLQLGIRCDSCRNQFMVDKPTFKCPRCMSSNINVVYSKEFSIDSIDIASKP
jgi:hydrogenase nickel incorporation protein HypA/HybF